MIRGSWAVALVLVAVVLCTHVPNVAAKLSALSGTYEVSDLNPATYTPLNPATSHQVQFFSENGVGDLSRVITLPFVFWFYASPFTTIQVSWNGFIAIGPHQITESGAPSGGFPYSYPYNNLISPFLADLTMADYSNVTFATLGTAPNRQFVVQWDRMAWHYCSFNGLYDTSFQVVFYEGECDAGGISSQAGRIVFNYADITVPCQTAGSTYVSTGAESSYDLYDTTWNNVPILYESSFSYMTQNWYWNNPCVSSPCLNGGTCGIDLLQNQICTCTSAYYGNLCQLQYVYNMTSTASSTPLDVPNRHYFSFSSYDSQSPYWYLRSDMLSTLWYYGELQQTIRLTSNGFLTFGAQSMYNVAPPAILPDYYTSSGLLAFLAAELSVGVPLQIWYGYITANNQALFVLDISGISYRYYTPDQSGHVQIVIDNNANTITVNYITLPSSANSPSVLVGIQQPTQTGVTPAIQVYFQGTPNSQLVGQAVTFSVINNGEYMCAVQPCQNGGTCVPIAPDSSSNNYYSMGYTCICPSQYMGASCQTYNSDPCASQPCWNGQCFSYPSAPYSFTADIFYCECNPGFTGSRCATPSQGGGLGYASALYSVASLPYAPSPVDSNAQPCNFGSNSGVLNFALPWTFQFFGNSYNTLYLGAQGIVTFGTWMSSSTVIGAIPTSTSYPYGGGVTNFAAWFGGVSLNVMDSGALIQTETVGQYPNRQWVLDIRNVPLQSCSAQMCTLTMHMSLFETDSHIEFHFTETPSLGGVNAVIGIQDSTGYRGSAYPFNSNALIQYQALTNTSWSWQPVASVCGLGMCLNGGTCSNNIYQSPYFTCYCKPYYSGSYCETYTYSTYVGFYWTSYTVVTNTTMTGTVAFGNSGWAEISQPIEIGFVFKFYGITYTQLRVCPTGYILFDSINGGQTTCASSSLNLGSRMWGNAILAFWSTNLWFGTGVPAGGAGTTGWRIDGVPGTRVFTLSMSQVPYTSDPTTMISVHVKLFETDSSFEIHFDNCGPSMASDPVTIGAQNTGNDVTTDYQYFQLNNQVPGPNFQQTAIRTYPIAPVYPPTPPPFPGGDSGGDGLGPGAISGISVGVFFFIVFVYCSCKIVARSAARAAAANQAVGQIGRNNNNGGAAAVGVVARGNVNANAGYQPLLGEGQPNNYGGGAVRQQIVQPYAAPGAVVVPPAYNAAYGLNVPGQPQHVRSGPLAPAAGGAAGAGGMMPGAHAAVAANYRAQPIAMQVPNQQQPPPFVAMTPPPAFIGAYHQNQNQPQVVVMVPPNQPPPPDYDFVTGNAPGGPNMANRA